MALLVSGAVKSQTAAAAAVGVSQGQLSSVKTQLKPAHYKFTQQPTEVVELSEGVTFIKEVSFGDETNMSILHAARVPFTCIHTEQNAEPRAHSCMHRASGGRCPESV